MFDTDVGEKGAKQDEFLIFIITSETKQIYLFSFNNSIHRVKIF